MFHLLGGGGHERKSRKKSEPKASKPRPIPPQHAHAAQSTTALKQEGCPTSNVHNGYAASRPMPTGYVGSPPQTDAVNTPSAPWPGYSTSPPQHAVYGAIPQQSVNHIQNYGSPPLQPVQPYGGNSTTAFATSPPKVPNQKGLKNMAAKSYGDLRDQLSSSAGKSVNKLTANYIDRPTNMVTQKINQGAALCDRISTKLDAVLTSIDEELFSGAEQDLIVYEPNEYQSSSTLHPEAMSRGQVANPVYPSSSGANKGSNHFSKVWLYSNSRLPPHLPPFKVYMPTYPLLCLAAQYSERVYTPPAPKKLPEEFQTHIPSDWRSGTKAMVLKSIPKDDMNTIVFAIRGSQTFMDWAVNSRSEPSSPSGFLDDEGNLCHSGFLYVARKMVKPVADRLRMLLQENPSRSNCSLLITGHSAGGAVAALLYAHMMSVTVDSDLSYLTGFFKRVHCVTFGAPPVSLLPLQKSSDKRHKKSLFFAFINEGDPVPRADKQFVRSLLRLYASPAPSSSCLPSSFSKLNLSSTSPPPPLPNSPPQQPNSSSKLKSKSKFSKPSKSSLQTNNTSSSASSASPAWPVPPCTLSPAGRLIVLRQRHGTRSEDDVEAVVVDDQKLLGVVYGDPLKHMMDLYKRRVERMAVRAVTVAE